MHSYRHLTLEEREKLFLWKEQGISLRTIGKRLYRSHSSLARELKRNRTGLGKRSNEYAIFRYVPCKAEEKAQRRGRTQRTHAPLKEPLIFLYVREHLRDPYRWSPEEIAGRLSLDHPGKSISVEAIYQYLYGKGKSYHLFQYLPLARKKRMKKTGRSVHRQSKIPEAISIDDRPGIVQRRTQPGHWETDNMEGRRKDQRVLSATIERVTRFTILSPMTNRRAATKTVALVRRLQVFPTSLRRTITADNGAENTHHEDLTRALDTAIYFCHPYHSWEKGTVENTIGRVRRYIPKGMSIDGLSDEAIALVEQRLNSTPRKCLQFKTPYERMAEVLKKNLVSLHASSGALRD